MSEVSDEWVPIGLVCPRSHIAVEILVDGKEQMARMTPNMTFVWFDERGRKNMSRPNFDLGSVTHWRDPYRHRGETA